MRRTVYCILLSLILFMLTGCMKWDYGYMEEFAASGQGLFITNEGNFQYGNATLSYYDPASGVVENEVFFRANGYKLGDVAQSMTIHDGKGWIVVNNSHIIFAIDVDTFKEVGRIDNLTSPRYILFVNDEKAYVSQIWDNRIAIVNPKTYSISGYITVPDMTMENGSTEQMIRIGRYVYCNCWSNQDRIIKIDTETDSVVGNLHIGAQPTSLVSDVYGRIWTITDGGNPNGPFASGTASLYCIDAETLTLVSEFRFLSGETPSEICIDGSGTRLYWINNDIWRMEVSASRLPVRPFIEHRNTRYYGLTVDPVSSEVYVADAIDYQQRGIIYRYSADGNLVSEFYAGVTPGAFCWKK